jgi:multidrug efflux system membrane fusion protein
MHGLYQDQSAAEREDRRTQANADALRAQVQADQAAAESARLQLDYCQVRAPLAGRVGRRMVDPGNIVKENESALVVVNQIQPIDVLFAVAEEQLPRIKQYQAAAPLRVEAVIAGDEGGPEVGTLIFIDNSVDRTTGTINLKARFQNDGGRLWPGQFVNVTLILTVRKGATVIPARAVQNGQNGPYVFVVREDQTVESRPIVTGVSAAELVAIDDGIKPGETVVTDGQLRLVTGTKVQIKPQSAPTADTTS